MTYYNELLKLCAFNEAEIDGQKQRIERTFEKLDIGPQDVEKAVEKCRGCGDCLLTYTAGICPVARCAKSLYNGPCGGSKEGHCEIDTKVPCAWSLIFYRLKKQNKLHLLQEIMEPRDWRQGGGKGPRERKRTGIGGSPGD